MIIGFANIYYWYNGLLIILQVLHVIWFYMILRMVYGFVVKGTVGIRVIMCCIDALCIDALCTLWYKLYKWYILLLLWKP